MIGPPMQARAYACRCPWGLVHAAAQGRRTAEPVMWKRRLTSAVVGAVLLFLILAPPIALLLVIACLLLWSRLRSSSAIQRLEAIELAANHAESGNLDVAAQLLARAARPDDATSEYARAALAIIYMRQGQSGHAVWVLSSLTDVPGHRCTAVRHTLEHALAYAHSVGGALEFAEQRSWAAIGLRHANAPLRYLLLCKRRRFSEVAAMSIRPALRERLLPTASALADAQLGWHGERVVALLCAFALTEQAASESTTARLRVREFLVAARPTYSGEYDYLQANWPELRLFIEEHVERLGAITSVRVSPKLPRARTHTN